MILPVTDRFRAADAAELYGIEAWGNGYVGVGPDGHLKILPDGPGGVPLDVYDIVREMHRDGISTPVLLRFPQLLQRQAERLHDAFARAISEYGYAERFQPLFPIKVNHQRDVVDALVAGGRELGLGVEVGSRPELLAAMSLDLAPNALLVCNGFKDDAYLEAASLAVQLGRRVVVVIEKPFELDALLDAVSRGASVPEIGFRIRLQARGSGLWEKSGGFASKFGLTTLQLVRALDRLQAAELAERVILLHFHIGSQITEIRKIKTAVQEAGRVYAKLRKRGVGIRYLDVGGGLGIDYDGSRTSSDASMNYNVQEYANDVVFGLQEVCEQEEVPPPRILTESGRMLTAYHSLLITDVRGVISGVDPHPPAMDGREHAVVESLYEVADTISVKNYREFYHDAIEYRDQMYALFSLGMLSLEERAKAEALFWLIARRAVRFSRTAKVVGEEFRELEAKLHDKYICNFSVFQSLPDHWALDQLFPVIPIHRLNEAPTRKAKLVDITCDSDGEVARFVDHKDLKGALELHEVRPGEPYYLAFLLVGAYQDTMGDLHNLFGRVHVAEARLDAAGLRQVRVLRRGDPAGQPLAHFGFSGDELVERVTRQADTQVEEGSLAPSDRERLMRTYLRQLGAYTYLGPGRDDSTMV